MDLRLSIHPDQAEHAFSRAHLSTSDRDIGLGSADAISAKECAVVCLE